MINWIIDSIPWWVYVAAGIIVLAATYQFWLPIWALMPNWMKIAFGAVAAIAAAFLAGRNRGADDERKQREKNDAVAVDNRKEVDKAVDALDKPALDKRLNKWMRD